MKKYDEYKDSGVAWIGDVPKHWKVSRIKFLISHSSAGVWGEDEKNDENDIVCFRAADFDYIHGCLRLDKMIIRNIQPEQLRGRRLHHGDLLIEKSGGGDSAPVGRIVRYNYNDKATCSNFVHFIRVNKFNDGNYLFYYFYAMYANNVNILFFNQTTGIQNLKIGEYIGQMIYTPILNEQTAIATYLDTHCAKIDNLISIQQKRIALLQELKQSVITHTVTKGLNPNVEMKQSGVEWIGDVPKHWEVMPLKFTGTFGNGLTYSPKDVVDNGILVLRSSNIQNSSLSFEDNVYVSKVSRDLLVNKGDIIICSRNGSAALVGKSAFVDKELNATFGAFMMRYIPNIEKKYGFYLFQTAIGQYKGYFSTTTINQLTKTTIDEIKVPLAMAEEQAAIASYLDHKCATIDTSISNAQHQIDLLQEYKQSLITEVVTGKRKVTDN